jgi:hypothetical protein
MMGAIVFYSEVIPSTAFISICSATSTDPIRIPSPISNLRYIPVGDYLYSSSRFNSGHHLRSSGTLHHTFI